MKRYYQLSYILYGVKKRGQLIAVNNPKFPALSSEVKRLKETEGGVSAVCEVMEYYNKEAVKAERIEKIQAMLKQNCSEEFILSIGYTKEDYLEAQKLLLCPV